MLERLGDTGYKKLVIAMMRKKSEEPDPTSDALLYARQTLHEVLEITLAACKALGAARPAKTFVILFSTTLGSVLYSVIAVNRCATVFIIPVASSNIAMKSSLISPGTANPGLISQAFLHFFYRPPRSLAIHGGV